MLDDGWGAVNRNAYSSGAGHSATQSLDGDGVARSRQFGHGYAIRPHDNLKLETALGGADAKAREPRTSSSRSPRTRRNR